MAVVDDEIGAPSEQHREWMDMLCEEYGWSGAMEILADQLRVEVDGISASKAAFELYEICGRRWPSAAEIYIAEKSE